MSCIDFDSLVREGEERPLEIEELRVDPHPVLGVIQVRRVLTLTAQQALRFDGIQCGIHRLAIVGFRPGLPRRTLIAHWACGVRAH